MKRVLLLSVFFVGCGGASLDQLRTQASTDLRCPAGELQLDEQAGLHPWPRRAPSSEAYRVRGCSQGATYVWLVKDGEAYSDGRWAQR